MVNPSWFLQPLINFIGDVLSWFFIDFLFGMFYNVYLLVTGGEISRRKRNWTLLFWGLVIWFLVRKFWV